MRSIVRSRIAAGLFAAGLGAVSPAPADDGLPPAHLLDARIGRTPRGMPRLVLETDRPVQFLTVELAQENGFEVHLLGTDPVPPPAVPLRDAVVRTLTFREGPQGLVARVTLEGGRRIGTSFALDNPPRVVLDLLPDPDAEPVLAAATPPGQPVGSPAPRKQSRPSTAPPRETTVTSSPGDRALRVDLGAEATDAVAPAPDTVKSAVLEASKASAPAPSPPPAKGDSAKHDDLPPELVDLFGWLGDLRASIDSIREGRDQAARSAARRDLAALLEERGLWEEAEKALLSAARGARNGPTGAADSLKVAELRIRRGDAAGALAVASALDTVRTLPEERVRLAAVFLAAERPETAEALAQPMIDSLDGAPGARALWVTARSRWDRGDAAGALPLAAKLAADPATPADLLPGAVLLEADCLCALERMKEARPVYERASGLRLTDHDASWTALQLGNLARREGRMADAKRHYETARDSWPDTFYATQADWFLRFDDRMRSLRDAGAGKSRG